MQKYRRCIIAGAGDFDDVDWEMMERLMAENVFESITLETTLEQSADSLPDLFIAADAGIEVFLKRNEVPDVWIGDFDSSKNRDEYVTNEKIVLPKEKNDTDMLAAIRLGLLRGYQEFHILGGTGKRPEHTLANIQCLRFLRNHQARGFMYGDDRVYTVIKNEKVRVKRHEQDFFSLFAMNEEAIGVTLEGFKYPLNQATVRNDFPIGVSNEFVAKYGQIDVKQGELLLVF